MAKSPIHQSDKLFTPLGGSSRKYKNTLTGEIISRYKFDKLYGSTIEYKGNTHAKAKANRISNPELSLARPAKGRKSTLKNVINPKALNLSSKRGEKFADVILKIYYLNKTVDITRLYSDFTSYIQGLKNNKKVFGVTTNLVFRNPGETPEVRNLIPTKRWPTVDDLKIAFDVLVDRYEFNSETTLLALNLHVIFDSKYLS